MSEIPAEDGSPDFGWLATLLTLYGIDHEEPESAIQDVLIHLTVHLGFLQGHDEDDIAALLSGMRIREDKVGSASTFRGEEVLAVIERLQERRLFPILEASDAKLSDLADLLPCWAGLCEMFGIDLDSINIDVLRNVTLGFDGLDYDDRPRTIELADRVFHLLREATLTLETDRRREGTPRAEFRTEPAHLSRRSVAVVQGLIPTVRMYATSEELKELQELFYSHQLVDIGRSSKSYPEIGFTWNTETGTRFVGVELGGADGLYFVLALVAIGMARLEFIDVDNTEAPAHSLPIYVPAKVATALLDADFLEAIVENPLTTPDAVFLRVDTSRHKDAMLVSPLLRRWVSDAPVNGSWEDYDVEVQNWHTRFQPQNAPQSRPRPPIDMFNGPTSRELRFPYLIRPKHVLVHVELDSQAEFLSFIAVNDRSHASVTSVRVERSLNTLISSHRADVKRAIQVEHSHIDGTAGSTLDSLVRELTRLARIWKESLDESLEFLWYSPGRNLTGVPLGMAFEDALEVPTARFPSLALSSVVADLVDDDGSATERRQSVDIFDCSSGGNRLASADRECAGVAALYPVSNKRYSADQLLTSTADAVHVSAHGHGMDSLGENRILLGAAQDESLSALGILIRDTVVRPDLVVLDSCTTGEANHQSTLLHESASIAQALVLHGAKNVIAAEWPISDSCGAWYSVAVHTLYSIGWSPGSALSGARDYFRGRMFSQDPTHATLLDEKLRATFGDLQPDLLARAGSLEHLAAFELHSRPRPVEPPALSVDPVD